MTRQSSGRDNAADPRSPSTLEVYNGLLELLRRAGVREPGGSVSCQRVGGAKPSYLVAAESYMAPRVQTVLTKLLARAIYFTGRPSVVLSLEEACKVASFSDTDQPNAT